MNASHWVALSFVVVVGACGADVDTDREVCGHNAPCAPGLVCVADICVVDSGVVDCGNNAVGGFCQQPCDCRNGLTCDSRSATCVESCFSDVDCDQCRGDFGFCVCSGGICFSGEGEGGGCEQQGRRFDGCFSDCDCQPQLSCLANFGACMQPCDVDDDCRTCTEDFGSTCTCIDGSCQP